MKTVVYPHPVALSHRGVGAYAPVGERDLPGRGYCRWNISAAKSVEFVLSKSGLGQGGMEYGSNECEGINPPSIMSYDMRKYVICHNQYLRQMSLTTRYCNACHLAQIWADVISIS